MFEYEGKDWTVEDIQAAADRKGVSYDDALAKLTQAGMKQKEFTFKSLVEDVPAFQWILRGTETVVNLVDEGINLIETGKVPLGADPTGMSNALQRRIQSEAFLIDAARKGIDPETAKELDPTNRIKLDNAVKWFRETLPEQELDENGQPKDYLKYYSEGEIGKGTNALIGDLAAAIPSLVLSMTPGGAAILGFTSYGEEFDKELYERSKDPKFDIIKDRDKLVANALITGASDFVTERIGGGLINKTIGKGFAKNTVEEILTKAPQELMKRAGFGFLSEFATEGATGVVQELADSWTFGDAYKPVSNYLRTFVKDGFVGGFLGGTVTARPSSKKGIYNYVSPQTYKKEQYELEKQIVDLSRDKENATSQKDITFFDNQIKQLKDQKKLNEQRLFDKFDNMTKAEKKEYAQNIDKQNEMLDIIGNNKYSKETQESAQKQLNKFAEANNKFFKVGDLKYDAELEVLVGKTLKTTERIKEQKGSFGFNKKNLNVVYLNNQSDVDNLLQKDEELKKAGFTSADGVFHKDAKDGPTIYINVPVASLTNQSNVLGHEYLHAIVSQAFDNIGATNLKQSVVAFKDYLIQTGQQELVNDIEERIAKSYNGVDTDGNIIRDENGLVKTKKTKDQEEYFNIFSDLIKSRKIQAVEEKSKGIKNSFRQLITGLGFKKVDFQNGKEVFDFLVDYNANMSRSGFAGKILSKRIAKTEFKGLKAIGQEVEQPGAKESRSYTKTPRDIRIDKLGEQYTKEQWDKRGAEEAIGELYMSGDLEAIVKNNLSSALRDLPGFSEEDFVSETIAELIPHIKNFNINRKEDQASFGLSGWIRGQVNNKIGNVLKAKKATREAFESDIEESTQAQVAVAEEQEIELLEEQDLSLVGQAKALKEKTERQSKLRRQLGFETGGEMYNKVLSSVKKSVLLAYRKTQSIKDPAQRAKAIKDLLRKEYFTSGLTSDLFKATKNFLGTKDYIKNLKEYREAIIEGLSTADLVQMERNVPDSERVFTVFDKKLTKIQEVEDAVNKGLLPTEAISSIGKGTAVNLYRKRMPTEQELVSFADQPAINPVTGQRSGLKGTRKDGFAKAIANSMVLDAVMEVRQSESVVEALENDAIAQLDLMALSDAVGREVDIKFSKNADNKYKSVEQLTQFLNRNTEKAKQSILVEKSKIENRIDTNEEQDGDQKALELLIKFEEAIENGLLPLDAYNEIFSNLPQGLNNINFKSAGEFVDYIKNTTILEIRQEGFKALREYLETQLKGKTPAQQEKLIEIFLRSAGRTGRTAKVFGITKNIQLKEQVIDKLLDGAFADKYKLIKGKFGGQTFKDVELYENIENIKNNVRNPKSGLREKINEQAKEAREFMLEILDSNLSLSKKLSIIDLLALDQRGTIRKMYTMGASVTSDSELFSKELTLEHEITVSDMVSYLKAYAKNKNKAEAKKVLEEILNQARVHVLPKGIDDVLNSEGLKSTGGRTRYQNEKVKDYLNDLAKRKIIDSLPIELTEVNDIAILGEAIKFSRSVNNPTKGITVLDFDDTLATSKSLVKFTRPDGSKGTLTPEQYAATYEDLSDLGYKFDFSEFSKVVDGKPAPLLNKAKKLAGKFGTENMFILTARPADSALAIKAFLKANGLDIPLKNITGLGNSTAEAKALWMADKVAEGYNDFYFADDALKNVQAVKNVLDQFDVKSKIQQARVKFSKSLSPELNKMIERNKGFAAERVFDEATAKQLGKDKGKYEFFISAGADDFQGLMMRLAGKGEQGDRDMQFFKETLFDPFNKAYREMNEYAYVMINDLDALIKEYPDVRKRFKQPLEGTDFDTDQAIRIYLWHKNGQDIPGLSDEQAANISSKVASDSRLVEFATKLNKIPKLKGEYVKPGENWTVENIKADIYNAVENSRSEFLLEWQENADELFSEENLNKLEAVYGSNYVDALKNILHRMKTGKNRPAGKDKDTNKLLNWINNSVGAIMFFNSRSAVLQMLSVVNFIDYENNNIFAAGKAFANQKQYWKDFSFLFNSPTLKMRRAGVQTDVSASDIAEAVKGKRNPAKAAIAYLLKIGFTPTQIADSFAISAGGATYYRNQVNFYIKEGMSRLKAEEKAFADFQSKTEEAQQSSRPDRISRQQASVLGRLILAFQNTPMQYNRIIKKAVVDIVNGRGDFKANASRILYYGTAQGLIFNALQNAIFALDFDDDEEKMTDEQLKKAQKFKERKYNRIVDGMISSLLRGSGLTGAYVDSIYKTIKEWQTQREKGWKADHAETIITALNVSPPIGSKFRKLYSAIKSDKFNKDIYDKMSYGDIEHPIYDVASSAIEAATNAPTQRLHRKIINIKDAFQENINAWQRVFLLGGWNKWGLGIEESGEKEEAREAAKKEKKEALKDRKPKKGEARCKAVTSSGKRCKNMTTNKSGLCYAHD